MLKFIHPADEKLMILDGLVPKFIGKIRRQFPADIKYYTGIPFKKTIERKKELLFRYITLFLRVSYSFLQAQNSGHILVSLKAMEWISDK